uniref:RNA-binding S4 domain-containing protein n=4 Tax=Setaria TaxID=4554 RepID=K3YTP2_SETIT
MNRHLMRAPDMWAPHVRTAASLRAQIGFSSSAPATQSPLLASQGKHRAATKKSRVAMMASRLRLHLRLVGIRPSCYPPSRAFAAVRAQKIQLPRKKRRLDEVCLERFQQYSRTYIQSWILQGKVIVDGRVVNKAGTQVSDKSVIEIKAEIPKYVCRAGHKLEAAIKEFGIDCDGKIALDSGLSTGGFTDCLLQNGASHVYGVDVGYGQVAEKIRTHERVSVIERTNLRYLSQLPQPVDLVTLDLSFISILLVMPAVIKVMKMDSTLITLIKPQFEARRSQVGGGGIVRDPLVHKEVLDRIISGVEEFGFCNKGWIESPIKGAEGNKEFLACFHRIPISESQPEVETKTEAEATW